MSTTMKVVAAIYALWFLSLPVVMGRNSPLSREDQGLYGALPILAPLVLAVLVWTFEQAYRRLRH